MFTFGMHLARFGLPTKLSNPAFPQKIIHLFTELLKSNVRWNHDPTKDEAKTWDLVTPLSLDGCALLRKYVKALASISFKLRTKYAT